MQFIPNIAGLRCFTPACPTPVSAMRLIKVLLTVIFSAISSVVLSTSQIGTGIQNQASICYMNALLSCLYDVTPFRKAVYDNYEQSVMIRALAGVFGRKQLNMLPYIDVNDDMMATISYFDPDWRFGYFQDIDEFLKMIFLYFPPSITSKIGCMVRERITTMDGTYVINAGVPNPLPMVTVHLPERRSSESLDFQHLVSVALSGEDMRDYNIDRLDHPRYFNQNGIPASASRVPIQVRVEKIVNQYADVVPVFVARRTRLQGSTRNDLRDDPLHNIEMIHLPLENGTLCPYTLTAFAVYKPGHYYAYTKRFPTREWLCYNDEKVTVASPEEVSKALRTNAVMIFYVKQGASVHTEIPEPIREWSMFSLILQHMSDSLYRRIKKMADKFSR